MSGWPWWRRAFWMGWGIDIRLRASYLTLTWRPSWSFYWSPDATPMHERARVFFGGRR